MKTIRKKFVTDVIHLDKLPNGAKIAKRKPEPYCYTVNGKPSAETAAAISEMVRLVYSQQVPVTGIRRTAVSP